MVTKNKRITKLVSIVSPDPQCLAVFIASFIVSGLFVAFEHKAFISDASANIESEKTESSINKSNYIECPTITSLQTTPLMSSTPEVVKETEYNKHQATKKKVPNEHKNITEAKIDSYPSKAGKPKQKAMMRLRAIGLQDGVIWTVDKNYEVVRIAVGDVVPGIGTIGVIRSDRTIKTTDGRPVMLEEVN